MNYFLITCKFLGIGLGILLAALAGTFLVYWFSWAVSSFAFIDAGIHILDKNQEPLVEVSYIVARLGLCGVFCMFIFIFTAPVCEIYSSQKKGLICQPTIQK